MIKSIAAAIILTGFTAFAQSPSPRPSAEIGRWKGLEFLIGSWDAKTTGGSAGAATTGSYAFELELRGHVLARHSAGAGCKAPSDFNCEHSDILYVYPEGPALKAVYFDNEGHVIHYDVTTPDANTAVFLSPASDPGPQFRLLYQLKDGVMEGRFQVRMPGQPEFRSYLEWSGRKK